MGKAHLRLRELKLHKSSYSAYLLPSEVHLWYMKFDLLEIKQEDVYFLQSPKNIFEIRGVFCKLITMAAHLKTGFHSVSIHLTLIYSWVPAWGQLALVAAQKTGPISEAVGKVVLSKALAISEGSRALLSIFMEFFISLFIFADFFSLHNGGHMPRLWGNNNVQDMFVFLCHSHCSKPVCMSTFNPFHKVYELSTTYGWWGKVWTVESVLWTVLWWKQNSIQPRMAFISLLPSGPCPESPDTACRGVCQYCVWE